jgi:hypothetical protein
MSDRLQELLQQRALIKEHLEWLDAEIAATSGRAGEVRQPAADILSPRPARPAAIPIVTSVAVSRGQDEADALLARLAAEEKENSPPTKSGCWILFCTALGLFAIGAWILLRYFYRG